MQRRELLSLTGAALLLAGGRTLAQSGGPAGGKAAKVGGIYCTLDGGERGGELTI
jgi:hypothetical protein